MYWILTLLVFFVIGVMCGMELFADYISRNAAITSNDANVDMKTLYPSVTLCPDEILNETKVDEFIRQNTDDFLKAIALRKANLREFLQNLSKTSAKKAYRHDSFNTIPHDQYMELIFNLSRHYDITVKDKTAVKIMTEVGICYTINNFLSEKLYTGYWRDLNPYPNNFTDRFIPIPQTFNYNSHFPLEFDIKHNLIGKITVYVHSPHEVPTVWSRPALEIMEDNNTYTLKAIVQEIIYDDTFFKDRESTEENRRRYTSVSSIKPFTATYSRNICLMECRAKFISELCNCVPHFYVHTNFTSTNICNIEGLNCFYMYIGIFRKINANTKSLIFKCEHCRPNPFEQIIVVKSSADQKHGDSTTSNILFLIEYPPIQSFIRSVMYTKLDFVVSLSGALSSFFGFTLFGLCDFVYFFTVRIYWFRKGYRGTVDELIET